MMGMRRVLRSPPLDEQVEAARALFDGVPPGSAALVATIWRIGIIAIAVALTT